MTIKHWIWDAPFSGKSDMEDVHLHMENPSMKIDVNFTGG
jgi:hypothetical protein